MKVGVARETAPGERRVALVPETVGKLAAAGFEVVVEPGAGAAASFPDDTYAAAGASLGSPWEAAAVVKVRKPDDAEAARLRDGQLLIGFLDPLADREGVERLAAQGVIAFAMESIPRITRAQSMDALSSQATVGGYKAALLAAEHLPRFFPMLMTAAGTVKAARVVILGVGVAGLQAIATAKRLGAVIEASDVRPSVKEQIESLGGKFIEVSYDTPEEKEAAEGVGGYAKPMPPSWLARQQVEVAKRVALADIVISTALIPGRAAPTLITEAMVKAMKPGSVIVDIAAGKGPDLAGGLTGGNCPLSEADKTVLKHGVTIVGETNLPALVAADASALYARNILDFLKLVLPKDGTFTVPMDDDIVAACLMTQAGEVRRK